MKSDLRGPRVRSICSGNDEPSMNDEPWPCALAKCRSGLMHCTSSVKWEKKQGVWAYGSGYGRMDSQFHMHMYDSLFLNLNNVTVRGSDI
jgi:hypothetical protein